MQLDAAGNIHLTGHFTPQAPESSYYLSDAAVAKVSPDGSARRPLGASVLGSSAIAASEPELRDAG